MSKELNNLNDSSSPGKYYNLIKNYNEEQIITLTNKVNLILTLHIQLNVQLYLRLETFHSPKKYRYYILH